MVTFDHRDPGTGEQEWEASDWHRGLPLLPIDELDHLIVVAAHPDDETLGAGGLMAVASRRGVAVTVVVLSNGEASHPHSPTHSAQELAALRKNEVSDAVANVAPNATVRLLNLPDGLLTHHVDVAAAAIAEELRGVRLRGAELRGTGSAPAGAGVGDSDGTRVADGNGPHAADGSERGDAGDAGERRGVSERGGLSAGIWIVAPWREDGHPDHAAAGEAAAVAAAGPAAGATRLWEYPIWAWHWSDPGSELWREGVTRTNGDGNGAGNEGRNGDANGDGNGDGSSEDSAADLAGTTQIRILELSPAEIEAKSRAMARHVSQIAALSDASGDEPIILPQFAAHFERTFETFIEVIARRNGREPPDTPDEQGELGEQDELGELGELGEQDERDRFGNPAPSLDAEFFDDFYSGGHDPWGFETRWYEKRKRDITLASLPRKRFASALELGSSIGVLTAGLAGRCDKLLATDIVEQPLTVARKRLARRPHVVFRQLAFPAEWPEGEFDLIVLSEVGYYNSVADLERLLVRCVSSLAPDGVLLACHWRHPVDDYPLSGDLVHNLIGRVPELERTVEHRETDFLLEIFEAAPARSVAQREGLAP